MSLGNFRLCYSQSAIDGMKNLPDDPYREALHYFERLKIKGPKVGTNLENKFGFDLSTCYKITFDGAKYRIIYRLDPVEPNCIEILTVGPRTDRFYGDVAKLLET